MLRSALVFIVSSLLAGCTSIGSKTVLGVREDDGWHLKYKEYEYRNAELILTIPEIVIEEHITSVGVVLPVIPVNHDDSYSEEPFNLHLTITGFPSTPDIGLSEIRIGAQTAGMSVPVLDQRASVVSQSTINTKEGKLWVQYTLMVRFDAELADLQELSLHFQLPMFSQPIPSLHLARKKKSGAELILTPGT
jgi:hypothetical protein